jgi:hypothetical protein
MTGWIFAALLLLMPGVVPQNNHGIIEGNVTRSGTTDALSGALITITRDGQDELQGEPDAVTDATGHFLIRNASPGNYTIRARRAGYISPMRNGTAIEEDGGAVRKIAVRLDQPLTINLFLNPGAAIAGRVLDPLGKPAEAAMVEASLIAEDGSSKPAGSSAVDDRGNFRIWGLAGGKYKLSVEYRRGPGGQVMIMDGNIVTMGLPLWAQEAWVKTYYPGTVDSTRAAVVDVMEGGVVDGIDFGFQSGQAFKISGVVVDPGRNKRSGVPDFYLIPIGTQGTVVEQPRMSQNTMMSTPQNQGAFEIRGIQAGRYLLYAEDWSTGPVLRDNFVVSQVVLDITSDLRDITLTMAPTATVEGTVRAADQPIRNARVVLIPAEEQRGHPMFFKEARTDSSGKFTIRGVIPADYTIYAIDPAAFKDDAPPQSLFAMPGFVGAYSQQGVAVRGRPEDRITVSLAPLKK